MVEPAIDSLRTSTSCKVDTEVSRTFLLKLICFSVASVYLRVAFEERRRFLHLLVSVSQVLVIPDVVVIVTFNVGCLLLRFFDLPPSWVFKQFIYLVISKLLE
jgi:hypothetical protein